MENLDTFTPEKENLKEESPARIQKLKNYGLAATVALSGFLASCNGTSKEPISSLDLDNIEAIDKLGKLDRATFEDLEDLIGDTHTIDLKTLDSDIKSKFKTEYRVERNDSTFVVIESDEQVYLKEAGVMVTGKEVTLKGEEYNNSDVFMEIDQKTGVIMKYSHDTKKVFASFETVDGQNQFELESPVERWYIVARDGTVQAKGVEKPPVDAVKKLIKIVQNMSMSSNINHVQVYNRDGYNAMPEKMY